MLQFLIGMLKVSSCWNSDLLLLTFSTKKLAKISASSLFEDDNGRMFSLMSVVKVWLFYRVFDLSLSVVN